MIQSEERRPLRLQSDSLILEQLPHELMIYDREQNKAFCLNQTAAFVWNHADGKTNVMEMAKRLGQQSDKPVKENEEVVWFAMDMLAKDGLLDSATVLPLPIQELTRRKMLQRLGVGAVALPVVTALFVSPAKKAHASSVSSRVPSRDLPSTTPNQGAGFWKWFEDLF
jgi:Coenzyme PQQ synthesis protein D (PqqD)